MMPVACSQNEGAVENGIARCCHPNCLKGHVGVGSVHVTREGWVAILHRRVWGQSVDLPVAHEIRVLKLIVWADLVAVDRQ